MPITQKKTNPKRPLSAMSYAVIALLGLLFASGFTYFYIRKVPMLVENGAQGQIFYLLLLPWALSCAAFLFGALRSYALFTYKHLGSLLELGGPVVLFCLVVVGGFYLVQPPPETIDLAVRAHSANRALILSGQVTLDLPGLPHANISPDGEANFKGRSAKLKGRPIRVLAQVSGYPEIWLTPSVEGNILTVELPGFTQVATLVPPPPKGKNVQIRVDGEKIDTSIDELGGFKFPVSGESRQVLVEVFIDRELVGSEHYTLGPGQITIHWTNPR
jgi:hypothetical protein